MTRDQFIAELQKIPKVNEVTATYIADEYGTVENFRSNASLNDLEQISGVSGKIAAAIARRFGLGEGSNQPDTPPSISQSIELSRLLPDALTLKNLWRYFRCVYIDNNFYVSGD